MTDGERAHLLNLGRRRDFRIDVGLRAREAAQRALGRRVGDAALFHQLLHQRDRVFVDDDGVVRHERADANGVVDRHERLDACAERAVVLLAEIVRPQIGTHIDQVLNDFRVAHVAGNHERRDAVIVGLIDVRTEAHEQLHDLEPFGRRLSFAVALDETEPGRRFDHRLAVFRDDRRIGAVVEQQPAELEVGGKGRAHQCRREDDAGRARAHAGARGVVDDGVRIGAGVEQLLDQRQRIGRDRPRKVRRRFHVAPVYGPEERREALRVGQIQV